MAQDRESGAAASEWGRQTARALAQKLGATIPTGSSNESSYNGKRIVIKTAAPATDSVGVTFKMLERLDAVFGAFQEADGSFEIWSLPAGIFGAHMRDTRSRGSAAGKVGLVRRNIFEEFGTKVERLRVD